MVNGAWFGFVTEHSELKAGFYHADTGYRRRRLHRLTSV